MMRWTQTLLHRCQADPLKHSASDDDDDDVDGYDDPYHTLVYDPLKHDERGHTCAAAEQVEVQDPRRQVHD